MGFLLLCLSLIIVTAGVSTASADVRAEVKALFKQGVANVDFAEVMVAVERIINPRMDGEAMLAEIDRMASHIQTATPKDASNGTRSMPPASTSMSRGIGTTTVPFPMIG